MLSSFTGKVGQIAAKSVETREVNKTFYLVAFCVESLLKDNTGFGATMNELNEGVFFSGNRMSYMFWTETTQIKFICCGHQVI